MTRYKLMAFTVGAFWAGMVGTLFAANIRTIEPTSFNFYESVILFAIVILGGSGSIAGVVLGAFLLIGLQDVFRGVRERPYAHLRGGHDGHDDHLPAGAAPAAAQVL